MNIDELESQALNLDVRERARLAAKLLSSLDVLSDQENERLWAEEAERRDREIESSAKEARPAHAVFASARSQFS
jgi:Putative addiction module component